MRLSVQREDPGYNLHTCNRCKILVDGVNVTNRCYTADEEEGKAWVYRETPEGKKFIDLETGDPAKEVLSGKVEIIL